MDELFKCRESSLHTTDKFSIVSICCFLHPDQSRTSDLLSLQLSILHDAT